MNAFPRYLAMGMSYNEYWNEDAALVKAYIKAHEIRKNERNVEMWLQGRYIYDAIAALSPILRTSLSKKPVRADPYIDRPYPLTKAQAERDKTEKQKSKMEALLARMRAESKANLKKREEKEASERNGE